MTTYTTAARKPAPAIGTMLRHFTVRLVLMGVLLVALSGLMTAIDHIAL